MCLFLMSILKGPLGDTLYFRDLCGVYKAGNSLGSGLGKKQVSLRHKGATATQQDFSNHILVHKTKGIEYVLHF